MSLSAGAKLGQYEILSLIGTGGMGELYRARDVRLGRHVAVKVLRTGFADDADKRRRFEEEAKAASALNHPNIITIHQIGDYESSSFIAMELVDGTTLRERLASGALELSEVHPLARQLCEGLAKAHEAGVVHGDLKPENIMVTRDGLVKIVDFGLARLLRASHVELEAETVTKEGRFTGGTLSYMAPEQALGRPQDGRSDLFSLGVVLYEMSTGRKPFTGDTAAAVFDQILHGTPSHEGLPASLEHAILRCLEKEPVARFQSALELLDALTDVEPASSSQEVSIAVVPFKNLSAERDAEFFSDGLTDDIILDLAKVRRLRVISRTSAMMFKGSDKDLRTVGKELGVQYVLEGSVRAAGTRVRVTAQLIDARTDAHVWGERFSGALEDIIAIQEELSRKIVRALKLTLTPEEDRAFAERPFDDVRAYECYSRARQEQWGFAPDRLDRALSLIDDGLQIVGDHELLYAAKGVIYWQYMTHGLKPRALSFPEATRCCDKAFALGGQSAQAHFLRGALATFDGRVQAAASDFKKVLERQPDDRDGLFWLCQVYYCTGRTGGARRLLERLFDVDPLTPANYWLAGWVEASEGRFEAAVDYFQTLADKDPENAFPFYFLANTLARAGRIGETARLRERVRDLQPGGMFANVGVVYEEARRGDRAALRAALTPELREIGEWHLGVAGDLASACAIAGVSDEALGFLQSAIELGWFNVEFWSRHDRSFETLHRDERFERLIDRAREKSLAFDE